jgi:F420-non-reducing hydrogenase small subunit
MHQNEELYGNIYEKNEIVCSQGDPGDTMYVIQYGAVEVSQNRHGKVTVLSLLEKGDFFGEMALIDDRTRSATVKALCRSRLLALTRSSMLKRLLVDPSLALHLLGKISQRIEDSNRLLSIENHDSVAAPISELDSRKDDSVSFMPHERIETRGDELLQKELIHKLTSLTGEHKRIHFKKGKTIFNEGDEGDSMYFILDGVVEISQKVRKMKYILTYLHRDDFFGEMSLISRRGRTATTKAKEKTSIIQISRHELFEGLDKKPELALLILQIMILRLRSTLKAIGSEKVHISDKVRTTPAILKKKKKMNINLVSLSACSGCMLGLLQHESDLSSVLEIADISYSPMMIDQEKIGFADIAIVDGAVRVKEEEKLLREVRDKCRYLVAWGTCAAFGGVPALANTVELEELIEESYGHAFDPFTYYLSGSLGLSKSSYQDSHIEMLRKAQKVDDIVKVDYYLPGCPPQSDLLTGVIRETNGLKERSTIKKIVCADCSRKPFKCSTECSKAFPVQGQSPNNCFNADGVLCMGFVIRGGCNAVCTRGGLPCWGCRGPADHLLEKMGQGETLENILTHRFEHHCKVPGEQVKKLINIITNRGNSLLRFDHYFIHQRDRLR